MPCSVYVPSKAAAGFCLIDLMIASSLVFFLLLGMEQIVLHSVLMKIRSDDKLAAVELAAQKKEELMGLFYKEGNLQKGEYRETVRGDNGLKKFLMAWTITEIQPEITSVITECVPAGGKTKKIRLIFFLNQALGF